MTKTLIGDVCADCGRVPGTEKRRYVRIGSAFKDDTYGSISLKIDAFPIPGSGWEGWVNIFDKSESPARSRPPIAQVLGKPPANLSDMEDDIPF